MKSKTLFSIAMLTAPLCAAQESANAVTQEYASAQAQSVEDFVEALCDAYELLETITDKATAESKAAEVAERMAYLQDCTIAVQYVSEETIVPLLDEAGMTEERLNGIYETLMTNRFYGSVELATALGQAPSAAMEVVDASPELIETIGKELQESPAVGDAQLPGGPGTDVKNAWVLSTDPSKLSAIDAVLGALPGAEIENREMKQTDDGRAYGVFTLLVPRDGKAYRMQLWFDATELLLAHQMQPAPQVEEAPQVEIAPEQPGYVSEPDPQSVYQYSAERKTETALEYAECCAELVRVYATIVDAATAEAAVPQLQDIDKRIDALNAVLPYVAPQELSAAMEKASFDPAALKEQSVRLIEADFFGSEALKTQFNN